MAKNPYTAKTSIQYVLPEPPGLAGHATRHRLRSNTLPATARGSPFTLSLDNEPGEWSPSPPPLEPTGMPAAKAKVSERVGGKPMPVNDASADNAGAETEPDPQPCNLRVAPFRAETVDEDGFRTPRRFATLSRERPERRSVILGSRDTFYTVLSDEGDDEDSSSRITEIDADIEAMSWATNRQVDAARDSSHDGFGEIPATWLSDRPKKKTIEFQDRSMQDLEEIALQQMDKRQRKKYRRSQRAALRASKVESNSNSSREGPPPLDLRSMASKTLRFCAVSLGRQVAPYEGDLGDDDSPSLKRQKQHGSIAHLTPAETRGVPSRRTKVRRDKMRDKLQIKQDAEVAAKLHAAINKDQPTVPEEDPDELVRVMVTVEGLSKPIQLTRRQIAEFHEFDGVVRDGTPGRQTDAIDSENEDRETRLARARAGKRKESPTKMTEPCKLHDAGVRAATGSAHRTTTGAAPSPYVNAGFGFAVTNTGQIPANSRLAQSYQRVQHAPQTPASRPIVVRTPKPTAERDPTAPQQPNAVRGGKRDANGEKQKRKRKSKSHRKRKHGKDSSSSSSSSSDSESEDDSPSGSKPSSSDAGDSDGERRRKRAKRKQWKQKVKDRRRSAAISKPQAPKAYDGTANWEVFEEFQWRIERYRRVCSLTRKEMVTRVFDFLEGKARRIYMNKVAGREKQWKLDAIMLELYWNCFPNNFREQQCNRFMSFEQRSLPVREYRSKLESIARSVGDITDRQFASRFMDGLRREILFELRRDGLSGEAHETDLIADYAERIEQTYKQLSSQSQHNIRRWIVGGAAGEHDYRDRGQRQDRHEHRAHHPPDSPEQRNRYAGYHHDDHNDQDRAQSSSSESSEPDTSSSESETSSSDLSEHTGSERQGGHQDDQRDKRYEKISPEEHKHRRANGLCFTCGEAGHLSRNCRSSNPAHRPPKRFAAVALGAPDDDGDDAWMSRARRLGLFMIRYGNAPKGYLNPTVQIKQAIDANRWRASDRAYLSRSEHS